MTFTAGGSHKSRPLFINHLIPAIMKRAGIRPNQMREQEP